MQRLEAADPRPETPVSLRLRGEVAPGAPPILLLGVASGLSPFGVTMLVPILGLVATGLDADAGSVQFLVSAYLFGLALAQPVNGFLCDRFGRRPVMLAGFSVFVVTSLVAAFSTSLAGLIALRFAQAVGVSVGTVASRAIVRDTRDARGSIEALSYIAAIMGFAPILAPILGGWLGALDGPRGVFLATAAMGAVILAWMALRLPETLHPERARPRWGDWLRNYRRILASRPFWGYTMMFGFGQGSFMAFLGVGAIVFSERLGIGEREFGLLWGAMAVTYVIGAVIGGRMTRRFSPDAVMHVAIAVTLAGGVAATVLVSWLGLSVVTVLAPLAILMSVSGAIIPGALAGAVNCHPEMAGTASGLSSALGIAIAGLFTIAAGLLYHGDYRPVAWLITASCVLTAAAWALVAATRRED